MRRRWRKNTAGAGRSGCRQSSSNTESGFQLYSLVHTRKRIVDHMRTQI